MIFRCKTRAGQYYYEFYEAIEDNTLQNNRYRFRQLPDAFRLDEIIVIHLRDNVVKIRRRYDYPHPWTFTLVFDDSSPGQAEKFVRGCLFRADGVLQPQESIESTSSNTTNTTEESTSTGIERQSSAEFDILVDNM